MTLLLQFCLLVLLLVSTPPCFAAPSLVGYYRDALEVDSQNPILRYHLGVALLNQGENLLAIKAFRKAYPLRSDDPEINYNLALAYSRIKDPDSALMYLDQVAGSGVEQVFDVYPLANFYFNLVVLYEQQGRLADAVELLQRLMRDDPKSLDYLRMLADLQLRLGNIAEASPLFQDYLALVPGDRAMREYVFATLFNRGLTAYTHEDYAQARLEFVRTLSFEPDSPLVLYHLALLDYQQEDFVGVAERLPRLFESLSKEQKGTVRSMLFNTALRLKQKGLYGLAESALLPLVSVENPRAKDLVLLAGIELKTVNYALARQHYFRALALNPDLGAVAEGIQAADKGAFEQYLEAAGSAFAANDLLAVEKNLAQAAQIYPQNNRLKIYQQRYASVSKQNWLVLRQQAETLEAQQEFIAALSTLREGLRLSPLEPLLLDDEVRLLGKLATQVEALSRSGIELYEQGDLPAARKQFEQLLTLSLEQPTGTHYLQKIEHELRQRAQRALGAGDAAVARNDLIAARSAFQAALVAWPAELAAQEGLARVEGLFAQRVTEVLLQVRHAQAEGRWLEARLRLTDQLKILPDAALSTELQKLDTQIHALQAAMAKRVHTALKQLNFNLVVQLLPQAEILGVSPAEITQWKITLNMAQRDEVNSQLAMARQSVTAGDFDTALEGYRRALDVDPKNEEALSGIKRGREALSTTITEYLSAADVGLRAGQTAVARQNFREALRLDPHQPKALAALRQIDRPEQSSLTPDGIKHIYLKGIEFYTEGDYRQAISAWEQVLELDPAHEKAQRNIAKAQRKLTQIRERQGG